MSILSIQTSKITYFVVAFFCDVEAIRSKFHGNKNISNLYQTSTRKSYFLTIPVVNEICRMSNSWPPTSYSRYSLPPHRYPLPRRPRNANKKNLNNYLFKLSSEDALWKSKRVQRLWVNFIGSLIECETFTNEDSKATSMKVEITWKTRRSKVKRKN